MTALIIDIVIIGIVAYSMWRGYRNGLIRGVFGTVALIAALLIANIAASAYSEEFEGIMVPFVGGVVDTALHDIYADNLQYEELDHDDQSPEMRSAFSALRQLGLPVPAAVHVAERSLEDDSGRTLSDVIAGNLSSALSFIAVFAVAFVLATIVFAVIGNLIGFVFSLPGLRLLDIIAGTAFGLVKGMIIILTIAAVVRYFGLLAVDILEETTILYYLVNNNIIANMLGI